MPESTYVPDHKSAQKILLKFTWAIIVIKCVFLRRRDNSDLCENHYLQYFSDFLMPGQTLRPDNIIQMYIQRPVCWLRFRKGPKQTAAKTAALLQTVICHLKKKNPVIKWNNCRRYYSHVFVKQNSEMESNSLVIQMFKCNAFLSSNIM